MNTAQQLHHFLGVTVAVSTNVGGKNYSHTKKGPGREHLQGKKKEVK